ncbi:MAG TPA: N-acetyltransferase [Steroidobacteraceae bacterium]|jgi:putative acetyltransferase
MRAIIRNETASDINAIETVTAQAFLNAEHSSHTEQFIVNALRNAGKLSISLVADVGGEVVGHVGASPVSISGDVHGWYGLAPVSVVPGRQRQGIGGQLVSEALKRLRMQGANGCVVLGDPKYYSRFGFKSEAMLILPGVPPEYFQALSFGESMPSGAVSYHQAFEAVA